MSGAGGRWQQEARTGIGAIYLVASADGLEAVRWRRGPEPALPDRSEKAEGAARASEILAQAARELEEYLAGRRTRFEVPLAPRGTEFQRQVWNELLRIPYGETRSYRELAERIGRPRAVRAVGSANGRNPLCILVPCHRVIAADGSLGGFSGGLAVKERLLDLERRARAR